MTVRSELRAYFYCLAVMIPVFLPTFFLEGQPRIYYWNEDGIVEGSTVLLHFLCASFIVIKGGWAYVRQYPYFLLVMLLMGLRELDFDKRFTLYGIFKLRFWTTYEVPMGERLFGVAVILVLVYTLASLVRNHGREYWEDLKQGQSRALAIALVIGTVILSKSLDGIARKLLVFGVHLQTILVKHLAALEETLEWGTPLLLLVVFSRHIQEWKLKQIP